MAVFGQISGVFSVDLAAQRANVRIAHRAKLGELATSAPPMLAQSAQREIAREGCAK